jgi:phytoene desaturase
MAPAGWHLYLAWSVPVPALGDCDDKTEIDITLADLGDKIPGFDDAKIVAINVLQGDWPAQRALSGFDPPHTTPITNLWNVGDGVKQHGDGGTEGCAKIAKIVAAEIIDRFRHGLRLESRLSSARHRREPC